MKNKKQMIADLGMIEARRLGLADKWDQLLLASENLVEELQVYGRARQSDDGTLPTSFDYLKLTLEEFADDE